MKLLKACLLLHVIAFFMLCQTAGAASESEPLESVKVTVDSMLDLMKDKSLSGPEKSLERRDRMKQLIDTRFDFREMSRRSLARHWKKITSAEQNEFVKLFSVLLQNSYINKIEEYTDEKISYNKAVIKKNGKYSVVKTSVFSKDIIIPIDYKLKQKDGEWRVYDVMVEGVSIVSNYRSQYGKILSRQPYSALIQKMKDKLGKTETLYSGYLVNK